MKGLADACISVGDAARGSKDQLSESPPIDTAFHCARQNTGYRHHFIVVDKIERNQIEIWDVRQGYSILPKKKFESMWEGYVLVLSPPGPQGVIPADAPDIEIDAPSYDLG